MFILLIVEKKAKVIRVAVFDLFFTAFKKFKKPVPLRWNHRAPITSNIRYITAFE